MNIWENGSYKEIWIYSDEDEQSMTALINGNYGWLMYLSEEESAGFSSRNPDYKGNKDETMEFYLSSGQRDEYPLSWILPVEQVEKAIDYFQKYYKIPPFITWHDDSE